MILTSPAVPSVVSLQLLRLLREVKTIIQGHTRSTIGCRVVLVLIIAGFGLISRFLFRYYCKSTFHAIQLLYVVVECVLHFHLLEGGLIPDYDELELQGGVSGLSLLEELSQLVIVVWKGTIVATLLVAVGTGLPE